MMMRVLNHNLTMAFNVIVLIVTKIVLKHFLNKFNKNKILKIRARSIRTKMNHNNKFNQMTLISLLKMILVKTILKGLTNKDKVKKNHNY